MARRSAYPVNENDISSDMSAQDFRISVLKPYNDDDAGFNRNSVLPPRSKSPFDTKNNEESMNEDLDA